MKKNISESELVISRKKTALVKWLPGFILRTIYMIGAIMTIISTLLMIWYVIAVLFGVYFPFEHGLKAFLDSLGN